MATIKDEWEFNSYGKVVPEPADLRWTFVSPLENLSKIMTVAGSESKTDFLQQLDEMSDFAIIKIFAILPDATRSEIKKQIMLVEKDFPENIYIERLKVLVLTSR